MKTIIVPLIGDPIENLYLLGQRERAAFLKIETRVSKLLSTNSLLRFGQDILSRARVLMKRKEESYFNQCIKSYADGLGIDPTRYLSFLSLFEIAAHYGQTYPELKGILPGCTSVFSYHDNKLTHSRLLDFPLIDLFEETPRLYYWKIEGKPSILSFSTEGLAPLFLQGIHGSGMSFAIHHKPGKNYHKDGQSIFQIAFESLFEAEDHNEFKKELRKKNSMTKWAFLTLDKSGVVHAIDIDGPAQNYESYNVHETSPLIFTNIPLQQDTSGLESFLQFSHDRQSWLKEKMKVARDIHPCATLSTVAAYHVNLSAGTLDIKEGKGALVASDEIVQISLGDHHNIKVIKESTPSSLFEIAWKKASYAQASFDQGQYDKAYHELQMAQAIMPHPIWKEIFSFYLHLWDFKFVTNNKELALIYKKVKKLALPTSLKNQWIFLIMRLEKRLDLVPTVTFEEVSPSCQSHFKEERLAAKPLFATWMKLIYPRMELLDVFSPHHNVNKGL